MSPVLMLTMLGELGGYWVEAADALSFQCMLLGLSKKPNVLPVNFGRN